ncbi:MAG TPA: AtpZ/AtpI family protein, partial [Candidatus Limnocylindrales bacterium]
VRDAADGRCPRGHRSPERWLLHPGGLAVAEAQSLAFEPPVEASGSLGAAGSAHDNPPGTDADADVDARLTERPRFAGRRRPWLYSPPVRPMENVPSRAPIVGLVLMVGAILSVPILGLTLAGLVVAKWLEMGPLVPLIGFLLGNVIGWAGVRWLYLRERRQFNRT